MYIICIQYVIFAGKYVTMEPNKRQSIRAGKIRKEIDITPKSLEKITAQAIAEGITFKPKAQQILEEYAKKLK